MDGYPDAPTGRSTTLGGTLIVTDGAPAPRGRSFVFSQPFELVLPAAQEGEGWAFDVLWHASAQPVTAFVRGRGTPEPDDLVNEIMLGVFRGIGNFSGDEGDYRAWVFRIARNQIASAYRKSSRRPQIADRDDEQAEPVGGDAESDAIARLGMGRVDDLLADLTDDQRDVMLLRIIADLTVDQVAEALGKPPGAVKQLQRRALRQLQKKISDGGIPR